MTRTDLAAFDRAWDRFSGWLAKNSPADHAALRPPATAQEIAALEARLGFPLHPELRALLERHNGVAELRPTHGPFQFQAGAFLPLGHRLNSTERIAEEHAMLVEFGEDNLDSELWEEDELNGHAHQWVTFAHPNDGGVAFVDHRPGPTYGHVYEMGIGSGEIEGTEWATGLGELFDRLADALEAGTPFLYYLPGFHEDPTGQRFVEWTVRVGAGAG
ncbi:SMI1/KNR4 family protein [Actinacidiphila acididurans]|uniref:SMI1/KNR4 family protein n=1 Tax=Actinacidiphila acididurans TaxID=2784346 RepID=A0ABS2TIM3_9ACTN|nr:SMI1/KNR4 family protein [Actinacidiphila acididurans]MBM9503189.1 SMI1/KNR4 family protein [Actinacidiphila acididurans]